MRWLLAAVLALAPCAAWAQTGDLWINNGSKTETSSGAGQFFYGTNGVSSGKLFLQLALSGPSYDGNQTGLTESETTGSGTLVGYFGTVGFIVPGGAGCSGSNPTSAGVFSQTSTPDPPNPPTVVYLCYSGAPSWSAPKVESIAIDFSLSKEWVWDVTSGYWDANPTDDPATGTGGLPIQFIIPATPYYLYFFSGGSSPVSETIMDTCPLFVFTTPNPPAIPPGFSPWGGGPIGCSGALSSGHLIDE